MLKALLKFATLLALVTCTAAVATAQPASFTDLGTIGNAGTYLFHTEGSLPIPVGTAIGLDTELGLWDEAGTLLDANDDGGLLLPGAGNGFESAIEATLTAGNYFLGGSIFNSSFDDNFVNTLSPFGADESADLMVTAGALTGTTRIGGANTGLDETGFFRFTVVPEPTAASLLLLGMAGLFVRRRA